MEWVIYIFENLNGDSSCLALSPSPIAPLPLANTPPPGDDNGPSALHGHLPRHQDHEEVLFDGSLNDILGGTLRDAVEQGNVLVQEDRVVLDLEIGNQGPADGHDEAHDKVMLH